MLPPRASAALPTGTLTLRERGGDASSSSVSFGGNQSLSERAQVLAGCRGSTKCGYLAPSGFDAMAAEVRRHEARAPCELVVLTAIFGCKDKLQQPEVELPHLRRCFFAIVDEESRDYLRRTAPRHAEVTQRRVGAWQLLTLREGGGPYASARRNSRVPKLLPFRLFSRANYSLWIDGKLRLKVDPMDMVGRYLLETGAALAAARNLKRDHIDEERAWIGRSLCGGGDARKIDEAACEAVEAQWRFYVAEQQQQRQQQQPDNDQRRIRPPPPRPAQQPSSQPPAAAAEDDGGGEEEEAAAGWARHTTCAEGAMVLVRLRSAAAQCVLCAWFNEWARFAERDQLALSYVLHALGVRRTESGADGVYFWPRAEHWNAKPRPRQPKPWRYVAYRGHSGTESGSCDER